MTACPCEAVGLAQIAERLGVQRETAVRWNYRGLLKDLPKLGEAGNYPVWCWPHVIVPWAQRKGKLPH